MKLIYKIVIVVLLIIGFTPFESHIASASYNESELLTDLENQKLTKILAADVIESLDSLIGKFSARYRFSGNILVAYNGTEIYKKSIGYADPLKKEAVNTETIFQLASVSKQFTAAAIMLLKADGRLDYDDLLVKYIPELPYNTVKLSHLLHHLSGLPNYLYLVDNYWKRPISPDNEDVVDLLAKYKLPLYFKPGTRYDYSNTGYVMLATVVQRISGLSLNDFLQARVFQPLGMKHTFVYSNADSACQRVHIDGFRSIKSGFVRIKETPNNGPVGDKGVCSTAEDLLKWDNALYNGSPISQELLEEAFKPSYTNAGKVVPYGLGFRIRETNGTKVVYHNGIWEGSRTNFHRYIEKKNTIIVLNNTSISSNHELVRLIENTLNKENSLGVTTEITKIVIESGVNSAFDYYCEMIEKNQQADIRKLMQVADFMYSIGKDKKAEEIKELCNLMVSI